MFEEHISHARDMIRRLEYCIGKSLDGLAKMPMSQKVRDVELGAWYTVVGAAISTSFGADSQEMHRWKKALDDPPRLPELEYFINRIGNLIALLQEFDGMLKLTQHQTTVGIPTIVVQAGDVTMGDTYQVGQAGSVGPHSQASHISFQQLWNETRGAIDIQSLASELGQLREALRLQAQEPEHYMSVGAVAAAEEAAKQGDGPKALEYLKKGGGWVLNVASKIGVNVASEALKRTMGLP